MLLNNSGNIRVFLLSFFFFFGKNAEGWKQNGCQKIMYTLSKYCGHIISLLFFLNIQAVLAFLQNAIFFVKKNRLDYRITTSFFNFY